MSKTNWKKLINPDYLGAYSLDSGSGGYSDVTATIACIRVESVTGADGKRDNCMVAHFADDKLKPMIINATNAKTLSTLFKSNYIEDWVGKKIRIGVEPVKAFGDIVDALRIRKTLPRDDTGICEQCGKPVQATERMSAAQVIAYARKRYGGVFCAHCIAQMAANNTAQDTHASSRAESAGG